MSEDETRYGAYAPPPDDYDMFDAREEEQDRRGWLFLAASAVVFVLFVAVVYNTFQLGVRERGQSPVITADVEPYRVAPDEPGGYEAPDQDLSAYELREGGGDTEDTTPAPVRPVVEEPVSTAGDSLPALQVETADADRMDMLASESEASEPRRAEPEAEVPSPQPAPRFAASEVEPEPEIEMAPPPAATDLAAVASLSSGPYVAQIGAFRSQADAEAGWLAFTGRFPELARGRAPDIQRADLGERGVFHRLRVAAFATREDASAFCASLDARGQACLVARR